MQCTEAHVHGFMYYLFLTVTPNLVVTFPISIEKTQAHTVLSNFPNITQVRSEQTEKSGCISQIGITPSQLSHKADSQ